jgi:NAD-dependent dihydropyrimidine dehydrogenase PreA subunit
VAREFAALAIERFSGDPFPAFELQKPFRYNAAIASLKDRQPKTERGWCNPVRFQECSMCRLCETECPTRAFDADSGLSDPTKCIECMHCLYICPDKALKIDDRMKDAYQGFLKRWHLTEEMMTAKKSKIITAAWQAAF